MLIELFIFAFIIIAYGTFTTLALIGMGKLRNSARPVSDDDLPFISIVISARNEEQRIKACIESICLQQYPKNRFELIITDDASDDATFAISKTTLERSGIQFSILREELHRGKKYNLSNSIKQAKGSVIITSDADVTRRHPAWLYTIGCYFHLHHPDMLVMPVDFETNRNILGSFQIVENIALTGITAGYVGIGKAFMCNGANLAFSKNSFVSVNGYTSHEHISSGEDVFLMEDIKRRNPYGVHYCLLRELIVKTAPQIRLYDFFQQRVRWAYKSKFNKNLINFIAGLIVVCANLIFPVLFIAILKKSVFMPYLSIFALAKCVFDFLLLFLASDFLGRSKYIWWLIPFECVYWLYALTTGIASLFYKPVWKGKKVN